MNIDVFVIRLLVVTLLGLIIGIERQLTGHSAGLKTTVLIAIGTMAFVSVEVMLGNEEARMAANIITGIGFLCSGVIFKNGFTVNGLNTSATLWCTAGIGVLIGYGYIWFGVVATAFLVVLNFVLLFVAKLVKPIKIFTDASNEDLFIINVVCLKSDVSKVKEVITQSLDDKLTLESVQTSAITEDKFRVKAKVCSNNNRVNDISKMTDRIFEANVLSVTWEKCE